MKNSNLLLKGAVSALFALATVGCGADDGKTTTPRDTPDGGDASGGSAGTGGASSAAGSSGTAGGAQGNGGGGQSAAGGTTPGGAANGDWTDSSPAGANGDVSGVVVNRLTGQVLADVTNTGIWKSANQGGDWTRVDNGVIGGLVVLGPGFDADQNNPTRVAAWSLDGTSTTTSVNPVAVFRPLHSATHSALRRRFGAAAGSWTRSSGVPDACLVKSPRRARWALGWP